MGIINRAGESIKDFFLGIDWFWWLVIVPGSLYIVSQVGFADATAGIIKGVLSVALLIGLLTLAIFAAGWFIKKLPENDTFKNHSPFTLVMVGIVILWILYTIFR